MASKKGGLGRGLGSLFVDTELLAEYEPVDNTASEKAEKKKAPTKNETKKASSKSASAKADVQKNAQNDGERVVYLKLNDIKPNSSQPRKVFKEEALEDLAASIREHGVIQPVLVRPSSKGYELVAGERRWRAARLAGLKQIPAIVRDLDERTNAFYALIENMQREDLNAIEEAEGIKEIIDKYGLTQEETAKVVGKSRPYVSNALRLLKLPEAVKKYVESGELSMGHARAVAGLDGEDTQLEAAKKAVENGWSVRQIENYTSVSTKKKAPAKKKPNKKDAETKALEEKLSQQLGTKVSVEGSASKGKIIIEYYSADVLESFVETVTK